MCVLSVCLGVLYAGIWKGNFTEGIWDVTSPPVILHTKLTDTFSSKHLLCCSHSMHEEEMETDRQTDKHIHSCSTAGEHITKGPRIWCFTVLQSLNMSITQSGVSGDLVRLFSNPFQKTLFHKSYSLIFFYSLVTTENQRTLLQYVYSLFF